MKKILNVELTPLVTSECWTYYKYIVMQTAECFDMWQASHMRMYMFQDGLSVFGEWPKYPLSYFNEILEICEKNIFSVSEKEIVQFLVDQIDKGYYILFDLNFSKLPENHKKEFRRHETLVYGYDLDKEIFFLPIIKNGVFKEIEVSFDILKESYRDIIDHYEQNPHQLYVRRQWMMPITLMRPIQNYDNKNVYYDFLIKLRWELDGTVHTVCKSIKEPEKTVVFYRGLAIIKKLAVILRTDAEYSLEEMEVHRRDHYLACLQLFEHQNIICRSMYWYLDKIGSENKRLRELALVYKGCCEKLRINVSMFQKYMLTKDAQILIKIADRLDEIFNIEKEMLEEFIEIAKIEYIDKLKIM